MKQRLLLSLLLITAIATTLAQSANSVTFKLLDSRDDSAIIGATVAMADSTNNVAYSITNYLGDCDFKSVPYRKYQITATFIGYDTLRQSVVVDERIKNLGIFKMKPSSIKMDKVNVNAVAIRTTQSGDTVIYNADAYKVASDATMDGLLGKMPGIKVDSDGEVEAQGEAVQKVYLDGKEFFGDDVALAVKNIPADIIAKVEVFNKLSDNAEFTGFDDGDSYKALNFITRSGMNSGHFGKFIAGYAHPKLYQASANYNYFRDNHRITIIGGANNMNIRNFGAMDLVGGGRRGGGGGKGGGGGRAALGGGNYSTGSAGNGLATIGSIGVNYGGTFKDERLKLDASYFYNMSDSETLKTTDAEYILDEALYGEDYRSFFDSYSKSGSDNYNHRVNSRIEYRSENKRHMIMVRPMFSFQETGSLSYSHTDYTESQDNGETITEVSNKTNTSDSEKMAYNINNTLVYRALIGDKGRNIMVMGSGRYSENDSDAYKKADNTDPKVENTNYNVLDNSSSYGINTSMMYSEPIMERAGMLTLKYSLSHQHSDVDYLVYDFDDLLDNFSDIYNDEMSNIYNSNNTTHSLTPGFMYSKKNNITLNANVSLQRTNLINEQEIPTFTPNGDYTFDHIMYGFNMRKTFNPTNSLRVNLRSRTSNPSITDLQEVLVDTDPTDIAYGNSTLAPSYGNSFSMTYNRSNIMMGRTFMAMIGGSLTNNYIGEETVMNTSTSGTSVTLPNGEVYTLEGINSSYERPVNLDGMWSVNTSVSYGTPVTFISSNLNLDAGVSYSESPSRISYNSDNNFYNNTKMGMTYKAGVTLGSNINENIDFTLAYNGSVSTTDYRNNAPDAMATKNSYFTNKATAKFKFVFLGGFTLFGDTTFTQYAGITDDFNEKYVLCNLSLGHKIFKNDRGEISFNVNDLFNQQESFTRSITDTYIANVKTNTIGRYYGIKLTFDLRKFKGSNSFNIDDNTGGIRRERPAGGMGRMEMY